MQNLPQQGGLYWRREIYLHERTHSLTGNLLLIVPSRGRPERIARMLDVVHRTAKMKTHVHIAIDDDDPMFIRYEDVMEHHGGDGDRLESGPRDGLVGWTNKIAMDRIDDYGYFGSFGDDHVPRTPGWDKALIEGIERMGGTGITYPWDGTREDIPEAPVVSADIIRELGWFLHPDLHHWYGDNVLADLGRGAGCIRHLRAIAVDHAWEAD